jgi:hypothetical protein
MNYAIDILSELAEAEAFEKWRKQEALPSHLQETLPILEPQLARKLALLRAEVLNVGVVASVVASIANAIESGTIPQLSATNLVAFTPAFSSPFEAEIHDLSGCAQLFTVVQVTQVLLAHMYLGKKLASAFLASTQENDSEVFCPIDIVADSWRRICRTSLKLHQEIAECMARSGHVCPAEFEANSLELLRAASLGGWPCISECGQVSIPGWAERRVEPRITLQLVAAVVFGPARVPAIIENATSRGLGLAVAVGLPVGAQIEVHLPNQRMLPGIVRWTKSGKVGVRLITPLSWNDPLFTFGEVK